MITHSSTRQVFLAACGIVLGAALAILPDPPGAEAAFPGHNGKIAFRKTSGIWSMRPNGTHHRRLTNPADSSYDFAPEISPGCKRILFSRSGPQGHEAIWVMRADGSREHRLLARGEDPGFSYDGRMIVFSKLRRSGELGIFVARANGTHERRVPRTSGGREPAFAPDGRTIVFRTGRSVVSIHTDGRHRRKLADHQDTFGNLDYSPSGRRIVFVNGGGIFEMRSNGDDYHMVIQSTRFRAFDPVFAPGGRLIAFYRRTRGAFLVHADGTGLRLLDDGRDFSLDWGPRC